MTTASTAPRLAAIPAYSEVMEDHRAIERALAPRAGEHALCIASAGDNAFHLALHGVRVAAIDVSADQIALARLKAAALAELDGDRWHALAGVVAVPEAERRALLARVRDAAPHLVPLDAGLEDAIAAGGLVGCGRLSAFVAPLREGLAALVGAAELERLTTSKDAAERARLWRERVDVDAVRSFLDAALCEATIADAFIPARAWSRMAEPRFGRHYHGVLRRLVVANEPHENPYLHRLWLGRFAGALPPYLEARRQAEVARAATAIAWHAADVADWLEDAPPASLDLANLSNVLDWCDDGAHDRLWAALHRALRRGARLFVRSFLVERAPPRSVAAELVLDRAASDRAAREDRVGYFSRYELWRRG